MKRRPDLDKLDVLLALRRHGTMKAVVRERGISQPTISDHLRDLAEHYGETLRRRNGEFTEVGELVADYAERILALVDELDGVVMDMRKGDAGRLVIGASGTAGEQFLPKVLGVFHKAYPGIELEINIGNSQELVSRVLDHKISFAFVGHPADSDPSLDAAFPDELITVPIFPDDLALFTILRP